MWIDAASKLAPQFDFVMNVVHWTMILPLILVNAVMVYFIIKYRKKGETDNVTSNVSHNTTIEVIWTVIPTIILMVLFVLGYNLFRDMRRVPADAMEINVEGVQWSWDFFYPAEVAGGKGRVKTGTLFLEENKHTKLVMKSRDVIHSFFVPEFRVKEDVVANMYTYVAFVPLITKKQKALKPADRLQNDPCRKLAEENSKLPEGRRLALNSCGAYRVFCTEYCGKDHSAMLNWAVVLEPADFKKKLGGLGSAASDVSASRGQGIYNTKCIACHSIDGSRRLGPSFKGLFGRKSVFSKGGPPVTADENYIRESIMYPKKKIVKDYPDAMTPQGLSEPELESMIMYLKTLK